MTKLVMMIVMACTVQAAAVFAQEPKPDDLQPLFLEKKEDFAEFLEGERATIRYAPRLVCTKADAPRPGARFAGGPCAVNFRMAIPLDNSPAWDCEKAHGVGNCLLVQFPNPNDITLKRDGFIYQREDPFYVPKCKQDFRHYFVFEKLGMDVGDSKRTRLREYWLYCGRPKQEGK